MDLSISPPSRLCLFVAMHPTYTSLTDGFELASTHSHAFHYESQKYIFLIDSNSEIPLELQAIHRNQLDYLAWVTSESAFVSE